MAPGVPTQAGATQAAGDPWLARWLPQLREVAGNGCTLELGCNTGRDTAWLREHGFDVVGCDISAQLLTSCARTVPSARLVRHDLRTPFPFAPGSFRLVVASLCLHYFDWRTTCAAVAEIRHCMDVGGLLACRLNSMRDTHYGAGSGAEIEHHYYRIPGPYTDSRRFFDRDDVERLLAIGWHNLALQEMTIDRFSKPKVVWEAILRKR